MDNDSKANGVHVQKRTFTKNNNKIIACTRFRDSWHDMYSSPPANIATKTIPHDQMSAGSALYSPSDKTYNGTQC